MVVRCDCVEMSVNERIMACTFRFCISGRDSSFGLATARMTSLIVSESSDDIEDCNTSWVLRIRTESSFLSEVVSMKALFVMTRRRRRRRRRDWKDDMGWGREDVAY